MTGCLAVVLVTVVWLGILACAALIVQWLAITFFHVYLSFWLAFFVLWAVRFVFNVVFK